MNKEIEYDLNKKGFNMSPIQSMDCPKCGGQLQKIPSDGTIFNCQYCGTALRVHRDHLEINSWYCPNCQKPSPIGTRYCNSCGAEVGIVCPKCRSIIEPGSTFCPNCRTNIEDEKQRIKKDLEEQKRRTELENKRKEDEWNQARDRRISSLRGQIIEVDEKITEIWRISHRLFVFIFEDDYKIRSRFMGKARWGCANNIFTMICLLGFPALSLMICNGLFPQRYAAGHIDQDFIIWPMLFGLVIGFLCASLIGRRYIVEEAEKEISNLNQSKRSCDDQIDQLRSQAFSGNQKDPNF